MEKDESYKFDFFIFRHAWETITDRKMKPTPVKYYNIPQVYLYSTWKLNP